MYRKIGALLAIILFVSSFVMLYAEMSDKEYRDNIRSLTDELARQKHDYIKAQNEAKKNASEQIKALGNTEKDITSRNEIPKQLKAKLSALKEQFLEKKKDLDAQKEALKSSRFKAADKKKDKSKDKASAANAND